MSAEEDVNEHGVEPGCDAVDRGYVRSMSRAEYMREYRRSVRESHLPADRHCPGCGKVVLRSRQWVLLTYVSTQRLMRIGTRAAASIRKQGVACRSCLRAMGVI